MRKRKEQKGKKKWRKITAKVVDNVKNPFVSIVGRFSQAVLLKNAAQACFYNCLFLFFFLAEKDRKYLTRHSGW